MSENAPGRFWPVALAIGKRRSALAPRDVARGVLATHRNGRRLFRDAATLLECDGLPGAVANAVLAHEEFGKCSSLGFLAILHREADLERAWRAMLENHPNKNTNSFTIGLVTGKLELPTSATGEASGLTVSEEMVRIRERATYVDCVKGRETWSVPELAIDREVALTVLRLVFAATSQIMTPKMVVRASGDVWMKALEAKAELSADERIESARARAAVAWSESAEATEWSDVDVTEARAWNMEMRERLAAAGG